MDRRVLGRGSASHSCDKVNRKILAIKSAAFLKKIGNGSGWFVDKLIDSLCFDIEPRKITGSDVPSINLRIVGDINAPRALLRRVAERTIDGLEPTHRLVHSSACPFSEMSRC
jgi:hypothetical protein